MTEAQCNSSTYTKSIVAQLKELLDINLTPGGLYSYDTGSKVPVDKYALARATDSTWDRYPNDTIAKHFLDGRYVVVDIDNPDALSTQEGVEMLSITTKQGLTYGGPLPKTFYSTTTKDYKRHYYYSTSHLTPKQLEAVGSRLQCQGVDLLGAGFVFEGHASPYSTINPHSVAPLPEWIVDVYLSQPNIGKRQKLVPTSRPGQSAIIIAFLNSQGVYDINGNYAPYAPVTGARAKSPTTVVPGQFDHNQITRLTRIIAAEGDLPENRRNLTFVDIPLNHSALNNVATKLTMIAELGHTQHVVPMLHHIIRAHGKDPYSKASQEHLGSFFSTLPTHEPIDVVSTLAKMSFYELCNKQEGPIAIFNASREKEEYVLIDKETYAPIPTEPRGSIYHRTLSSLEVHFPQYMQYDQMGMPKKQVWPAFTPIQLDFDLRGDRVLPATNALNMVRINTYTPPRYKTEAELAYSTDILLYKALLALVGPDYIDYTLAWFAYAVYSPHNLVTIPMVVSAHQGTGKSFFMWKVLHFLTGACYSIDASAIKAGWGDAYVASSALCFDDVGKLSHAEWSAFYAPLKNMTNGGAYFLNMKGKAMKAVEVNINMTITSNERIPHIDEDDRRLFCIEPAALTTHPHLALTKEEMLELERIRRTTSTTNEHIQAFANLLKYTYETTSTEDGMCSDPTLNAELFTKAPHTHWREEWITGSTTHSKNLYNFLDHPDKLLGLIKEDPLNILPDYIEMVVLSISANNKLGLSWHWFRDMLPLVSNSKDALSKLNVESRLGLKMVANVGATYTEEWEKHSNPEMRRHTAAGYVVQLSKETVTRYKEMLLEMREGKVLI